MRDYEQCGLPVRRRGGSTPCILQAGHRETWCQDRRAIDLKTQLDRVPELAQEARSVLGLLGCVLGRGDTERWIRRWISEGGEVAR